MPVSVNLPGRAAISASFRRVVAAFSASLLLMQLAAAHAQVHSRNLDLGTTSATVNAHLPIGHTVSINLGGTQLSVAHGALLTPAEQVAVSQIVHTGHQSLILGTAGNAVGGTVNLTYIKSAINNLVIPQGVTALRDFGNSSTLNLLGNLTNAGQLYAFSSSTAVHTAVINAANISNLQGALISSALPAAGIAGINNVLSNFSLSLNATNNIVNAGTIGSGGSLSMSAGGSIVNALPAGASGPSPALQAFNNVNLTANSITNAGTIAALAGNINVQAATVSSLAINNSGGTMQALAGAINIGDPALTAKVDLNVSGGDFLSKQLNLYSGQGTIDLDVGNVTGIINASASEAHIQAATENLELGNLTLSGDPTFFNTAGNVTLNQDLWFPGQNLAIVAKGSILTAVGIGGIDTSSTTGSGGAITLIAGAQVASSGNSQGSNDSGTTLTISAPVSNSGIIDLTGGGTAAINRLTSASFAPNGSGGNIQLIAFGTSGSDGGIFVPKTVTITTSGAFGGSGTNGNVTIIGSGIVPSGGAPSGFSLGGINTSGAAGGSGNIFIATTDPQLHSATQVKITNGAVTQGSFDPGSSHGGSISVGTINAGGATSINAGGNLTLNSNITTNGQILTLIATGNILEGTPALQINTSSNTSNGGLVIMMSGFVFNGSGPNTITIGTTPTSYSTAGGSVLLPGAAINTSSLQGANSAGSVAIFASPPTVSFPTANSGLISLGSLTGTASSTAGTGGTFHLVGGGGIQINGFINGSAATTGSLTGLNGDTPQISVAVSFTNGALTSGSFGQIASSGAAIFVNGSINLSASAGTSHGLTMASDSQIEINGSINTTGTTGGGSVTLTSTNSFITVSQGINTSAVNTLGQNGSSAGTVTLSAASAVIVSGNIQSTGQTVLPGTVGSGGAGGPVNLTTSNLDSNGLKVGEIVVSGFVDTRGGDGIADGNGAGGSVTMSSGSIQIMGTNAGVSINTTGGTGSTTGGTVQLTTFETQLIPTNFDLTVSRTQTNLLVPAVPGGLFTIGTFNPVNGTTGNIVSGSTILSSQTQPVRLTSITQGNIAINATAQAGPIAITEGGGTVTIHPSNAATPTVRNMLTPAEALAFYQDTHGQSATQIGLNANGQSSTPNGVGETATIAAGDISQPFTSFNLQEVNPNNSVILFVTGARPLMTFSGPSFIGGTLNFSSSGSVALVDFGVFGMNVGTFGSITGSSSTTLLLAGSGGLWSNNGSVLSQNIVIAPTGPLTFNTANLTGSGGTNPTIVVDPSLSANVNITFNVPPAAGLALPITFSSPPVPATYRNLAQSYANNFNQLPAVNLSFASGATPASILGSLNASTLSLITTSVPNGINPPIATALTLNGNFSATQLVNISTAGTLAILGGTVHGGQVFLSSQQGMSLLNSAIVSATNVLIANSLSTITITNSTMVAGSLLNLVGQAGVSLNTTNTSNILNLSAGSLNNLSEGGFQNVPQASVQQFGSIFIQALGAGGFSVSGGGQANITSNGGSIIVNSTIPTIGISIQNGVATNILANGGNINFNFFAQGQNTSTSTVGGFLQATTLNGGAGAVIINSTNALTLTNAIQTLGLLQINVASGILTYSGGSIQAGSNINLLGLGGVAIAAGSNITAGSLSALANPFPNFILLGQIPQIGGIFIQASGAGGFSITGSGTTKITSDGSDITILSTIPQTGLSIPTGTTFLANGGNLNLNFFQQGATAPSLSNITANFEASIYAGLAGNIFINLNSANGVTFGSGSTINGRAVVQLNVIGGPLTFNGSSIQSGSSMGILSTGVLSFQNSSTLIQSVSGMNLLGLGGVTFLGGETISAGALSPTAPSFPNPLNQSNVFVPGSIFIEALGTGFNVGNGGATSVTSNAGDITIVSTIPDHLTITGPTTFQANGGNLNFTFFNQLPGTSPSNIIAHLNASTLNGGGGNISFNFIGNPLSFNTGSSIDGLGAVQVNAVGSTLFFGGSSITSGSSMNILGTSGVTVNAGAIIAAGSLNGAVPFGPLTQANIQEPGSILIQGLGSGGFTIAGAGTTSITSNGGGVTIISTIPAAGLSFPSGTTFTANGGNLNFNFFNQATTPASATINAALKASTLNGGAGSIFVNFSNNPLVFSGGSIDGLGVVQLNVSGGSLSFDGSQIISGSVMNILGTNGVSIGAGALIAAGSLNGAVPFGPLTQANISQSGSISIQALGTGGFGITGTGTTNISSNGGDINIISTIPAGGISTPANTTFTAAGGNVNFNFFPQGGAIPGTSNLTATINAQTLNGGAGNVFVISTNPVTFAASSAIDALGLVQATVTSGSFTFNGSSLKSGTSMLLLGIGGITLSAGALTVSSGSLMQLLAPTGTILVGSGANLSASNIMANGPTITYNGSISNTNTATLTATSALSIGGNASLITRNNLTLQQIAGASQTTIAGGAILQAGQLNNDPGGFGALDTSAGVSVASAGSVLVQSFSSLGLKIGGGTFMTSNGGDVNVTSIGNIVFDFSNATSSGLRANGGNVIVLSLGTVTQNSSAANIAFTARGIGTSANAAISTGGGIEIGSGTLGPQIAGLLPQPFHNSASFNASTQGVTVGFSNHISIVVNELNSAQIKLNSLGDNSSMTLNHGAIQLDALTPNSSVQLDGAVFNTSGFLPIAFISPADGVDIVPSLTGVPYLRRGTVFIETKAPMKLHTELADIYAGKKSLVQVDKSCGRLHVRSCSGINDVTVVIGDKKIVLRAGQELIVTDHSPVAADLRPEDGIGRREHRTYAINGQKHVTVCDFSMVSLISGSSKLMALRHSKSAADRRLIERLVRAAASVDYVMKGKGSYIATPRAEERTRYTEAYRSPALHLPPSDYYSSSLP